MLRPAPQRPIALCVLGAAIAFGGPAAAAPVATDQDSPVVQSESVRLSSIGQHLLPVTGGFLVRSEADRGLTAVTFIPGSPPPEPTPTEAETEDSGPTIEQVDGAGPAAADLTPTAELIVTGDLATQGGRVVAVDAAGPGPVEQGIVDDPQQPILRLFRLDSDSRFVETGFAALPEEIRTEVRQFGTALAIGGNAIAVVSETTSSNDRVDIFRVSPDGTAEWFQELSPGTLATQVAVSTSGGTIALSGVNRLAASGELIINRIGPSGWVPTQRFLRIGGGKVHMQNDRILVQRNSFFSRPDGSWTVIDSAPGRPYEARSELPVEGDTLATGSGVVVVGDSRRDLVYVLEETSDRFRFAQAIRPPSRGSTGAPLQFGASVLILPNRSVIVGAPGPGAVDPAGQVFRFALTDGPVGCTIVGSDDSDELSSPIGQGRQTLCGLRGDDVIVGSTAGDVVFGGPGDDTITGSPAGGVLDGGPGFDICTQAGPTTGPTETSNCEG